MRNVVLHGGSSGQAVRELQVALNNRLNPSPNLIVNGLYTPQTERAVRSFQRSNWLEVDGLAGRCTLDALNGREAQSVILHNVPYFSQPTPATCWAAATAILARTSVQQIRMTTPARFLNDGGSLINDPDQRLDVHQGFAQTHRLRYHPPQNWPVETLIAMLRHGPILLEYLQKPASFRAGDGAPGHYVVVVGARGSHLPDGSCTTLRIYDPAWGPEDGIYSLVYAAMLKRPALATFGIFTQ